MKHLEGKEVWLHPTGNNVRRVGPNLPRKAVVEKVARVFVTVRFDGWTSTAKLRISDYKRLGRIHLSDGYNGGYVVFECEKDYAGYDRGQKLRKIIYNSWCYGNVLDGLDEKELLEICRLLKLNTAEGEDESRIIF